MSDVLARKIKKELNRKLTKEWKMENEPTLNGNLYDKAKEDGKKAFKEAILNKPPNTLLDEIYPYYLGKYLTLSRLEKDKKIYTEGFTEGWENSRDEYLSELAKKNKSFKADLATILKIKAQDSELYSIYQKGYETGQDKIANLLREYEALSKDELDFVIDELEKELAELLLSFSSEEEKMAFAQGFHEAIEAMVDEYYYGNI